MKNSKNSQSSSKVLVFSACLAVTVLILAMFSGIGSDDEVFTSPVPSPGEESRLKRDSISANLISNGKETFNPNLVKENSRWGPFLEC